MPPSAVFCPRCGAVLGPGDGCEVCGLPLVGPAAAELWEVDQQLAALQQRRWVLLATLQSAPQPSVAAPLVPTGAALPTGPHAKREWPAQQVLLAVGALLVLVAASVFLAVAWGVIGVGGQVAVMAAVTLIAGGSSVLLARRRLRASADALAVLAVALAVVDAAAARWLDLAGLSTVGVWAYAACVTAVLALVLVAVSPPLLRDTAATYRFAAVLAVTVAPLLGLVAAEPSRLGTVVVCAVVAALAALGSRRLAHGWAWYRRPSAAIFGGYLVLTWLLAPTGAVDGRGLGDRGLTYAVGLVVVVGAGWAADLHGGLRRAVATHPVLATTTLLGGAVQVVALAAQGGLAWVALLAVVAAVVLAFVAATTADLATARVGVAAAAGQLVSVGALVVSAVMAFGATGNAGWAGLTAALAGTCCGAAMVAVGASQRPRWRRWSAGWAAATGAAAVAAVTAPLGLPGNAYAISAAAAALVAVTAAVRARLEPVVGSVAVVTALLAVQLASTAVTGASGLPPLAPVLAGLGVLALAYGIRPQRGWIAWVGVVLCSAGNAVQMSAGDVAVVEAYSLPLAVLALVVGLVRLRRQPDSPSWLTVGPAVSAGLLPSAFATVGDPSLIRPVVVLVVAAAAMMAGIALHWQAPVLTGALAACVVAVAQLAPYAVGLPRWVSFGAVGVVLLVLGLRYEQRRRDASHAVRWMAALR